MPLIGCMYVRVTRSRSQYVCLPLSPSRVCWDFGRVPSSCACIRSRDARRGVKWASTVERVAFHLYLKLPSPSGAPYKQDATRTGRDGGVVSITTLTSSRTANVRCAVPVLHRVLRHREFRYLIEVVEQVGDMLPYGSFVISSLGVGCTRQHITAG